MPEQVTAEEPKHEPGEEPDGQDEDQPGNRPHVVVDNDVKEVYHGFKELTRKRHGWELAQSLRYAALLAPELFAGMHPNTPRKWKLRVARGCGVPPGRARALPTDVCADLALTASRICTRVPTSSPVMAVVFEAQLEALGHPPMAERSVRELLSKLGLSYPEQVCNDEDIHSGGSGRSSEERAGKTHFHHELARHRRVTDHQRR